MTEEIIIDGVNVAGCEHINCCDKKIKCVILQDNICEINPYCESYDCYYKQLKRFEEENAELKAENEQLKEDYIKLYQQKDLDNAKWQKRCTDLHIEDKSKADKYWLALQEIKSIAEDAYENDSEYQATGVYNEIIQKITKVEE